MKENVVPLIGAAGNVGKGISKAFKNEGWEVSPIDPEINKKIEDLSDKEFRDLFSQASIVAYAADCGNREEYEEHPNLGEENKQRFSEFCQRAAHINPNLTVWYIGGSWTKRKPDDDWIVNDDSPNKSLDECNPYEKAKVKAEENAERTSKLIKVRFLDWASIVPNLAPNFSITKMMVQALKEGRIRYSPDEYGRPLIESVQAGEALIVWIKNDNGKQNFAKYLIPASFVRFSFFAQAVKEVVDRETGKEIILEEIEETPNFLRSQCHSDNLEGLGFRVDEKRTLTALKENAEEVYRRLKEDKRTP